MSDILSSFGINVGDAMRVEVPPGNVAQETSTEPPPAARSVEQRLRELSDLRGKGLITQAEYDEQRQAILRSLSKG